MVQADLGDGNFNLEKLLEVMVKSYKSLEEEEQAILKAFKVFDKENTGKIDAKVRCSGKIIMPRVHVI